METRSGRSGTAADKGVLGKKQWGGFFVLALLVFVVVSRVLPSIFVPIFHLSQVVMMGAGLCAGIFLVVETKLAQVHDQTVRIMHSIIPRSLALSKVASIPQRGRAPREQRADGVEGQQRDVIDDFVLLLTRLPLYPLMLLVIVLNAALYCIIFTACLLKYTFGGLGVIFLLYLYTPDEMWDDIVHYILLPLEIAGAVFLAYQSVMLIDTHQRLHEEAMKLKAHQLRRRAPQGNVLRMSRDSMAEGQQKRRQGATTTTTTTATTTSTTTPLVSPKHREAGGLLRRALSRQLIVEHKREATEEKNENEENEEKNNKDGLHTPQRAQQQHTPQHTPQQHAQQSPLRVETPGVSSVHLLYMLNGEDDDDEHEGKEREDEGEAAEGEGEDEGEIEEGEEEEEGGGETPGEGDATITTSSSSGEEGHAEDVKEKETKSTNKDHFTRTRIGRGLKKFTSTYLGTKEKDKKGEHQEKEKEREKEKEKEKEREKERERERERELAGQQITALRVYGAERRKVKRKWLGTVEYTAYLIWVETDHEREARLERSYEEFQIFDKALRHSDPEKSKAGILPELPVKDKAKLWRKLDPLDTLKMRLDLEYYLQQVWTTCGGNNRLLKEFMLPDRVWISDE